MNKRIAALIAIVGALAASSAYAQISLTNYNTFVQDFDSMGSTGTTTPTGWTVDSIANPAAAGTATDTPLTTGSVGTATTVTAGTGTSGTGNSYNFGVAGTNPVTDRALGSLASAGNQKDTYVSFTNNTGNSITQLTITYDGEQWRLGTTASAVGVLTLQYSDTGTSWVNVGTAFNFTSPITTGGAAAALDGNAAPNRVANIGGTFAPASPITNGSNFFLRWADPDDGSADNALAIDNFMLAIPEPKTVVAGILCMVVLLYGHVRRLRRRPRPVGG